MSSDAAMFWRWWPEERTVVRVLAEREVWGYGVAEVLDPSTGQVRRCPVDQLRSAGSRPWSTLEIAWRAAATRAIHLSTNGELLTVGAFDVEPLPHQLRAVGRAIRRDPVRLLLADEVGLGKTIEAGLIYSELKARGRARRVLVVAPKGVQLQWVSEMRARFGEEFALVGPGGVPVDVGVDPWQSFDRVVCSFDAVKPLRRRAGWSPARVEEHNERRFQALLAADWDLVIIDEAHHVAGATDVVARHELARELARRSPNLLLLSATPHSGKSEAFTRLLVLVDPELRGPLSRAIVAPYIVRTEKRAAVDARGVALFQPRATALEVVPYGGRVVEAQLYAAVTEYVRHGYDRARRERQPAIGFLLLLMQRLVSSSSSAILAALERRAEVLTEAGEQLRLSDRAEGWEELTGEEQYEVFVHAREAWGSERREVLRLLELARASASNGIDAKAAHLIDLIGRLRRIEQDPAAKVVVFTEFVPTQAMLLELFERIGVPVTAINGSMTLEERALAQETFRESAQVLVSTDAGGEGINLQFANLVVNYDLPWNPMRIEQRIGRVDRIGQRRPVRAFNLVMEHSVDQRVLEVLEEKLWRILRELGTNKWDDVLETASSRVEEFYAEAIVHPESVEDRAVEIARRTQEDIDATQALRELLVADESGPAVLGLPTGEASRWLARAAEAYRQLFGGAATDAAGLTRLPEAVPGESVPTIRGEAPGTWSCWEVRPDDASGARDCVGLFVTDDGQLRPDIAEAVWVRLAEGADISTGAPFDASTWTELGQTALDHGYAAGARLLAHDHWTAPWLTPRLVVRVLR